VDATEAPPGSFRNIGSKTRRKHLPWKVLESQQETRLDTSFAMLEISIILSLDIGRLKMEFACSWISSGGFVLTKIPARLRIW
jgi:hypothetical protein